MAVETTDFMPSEAVIAGIRKDIEDYEARRASAYRQVRWRVPVFVGLVVVFMVLVAWLFNKVADPNEQWFSTPHVFLYFGSFVAALLLYFQAMKPATQTAAILPRDAAADDLRLHPGHALPAWRYARIPSTGCHARRSAPSTGRSFDDVFSGRYEGFAFELYEAELREGTGKGSSTAFRGVIVAFETIAPFPGTLVATRRANVVVGFFRGMFASRMEELSSGVSRTRCRLRIPHRQCRSGPAAGERPAGAGAEMAR